MPRPRISEPVIYPKDFDIKKTWFVKYRSETGKLAKRYGKINSHITVKDRLNEARALIKAIKAGGSKPTPQKTLIRCLSSVIEAKKGTLRLKSYQTYISILANFAVWYRTTNDKNIVDAGAYVSWLRDNKKHTNYIRKCVNLMRSLFEVLLRSKRVKSNPFFEIRIKKIKAQSKLPFHLSHIEPIKKLCLERNPQIWDVVEFLYYLYFRPSEVRKLKIEHILFEDMRVIASDDVLKDKDNYLKVIPKPMEQHILKYKGCNPNFYIFGKGGKPSLQQLGVNELCRNMTKILRELNFSRRYSLYSWVHTGIKQAALSNIPIKQLQLQKGHSDLNMFNEYLKDLGVEDCTRLINEFPAL